MNKTKEEIGMFNEIAVTIPQLKKRICEQHGHFITRFYTYHTNENEHLTIKKVDRCEYCKELMK